MSVSVWQKRHSLLLVLDSRRSIIPQDLQNTADDVLASIIYYVAIKVLFKWLKKEAIC